MESQSHLRSRLRRCAREDGADSRGDTGNRPGHAERGVYPPAMGRAHFSLGAVLAATAVAAGALGAHVLRARLDASALELWETAVRYLALGAVGLLVAGLASVVRPAPGFSLAGTCLLAGVVIFSGTVGALALGGPRWLGAVTPVGGLLLIAGFLVLAAAGARGRG